MAKVEFAGGSRIAEYRREREHIQELLHDMDDGLLSAAGEAYFSSRAERRLEYLQRLAVLNEALAAAEIVEHGRSAGFLHEAREYERSSMAGSRRWRR